MPVGSSNPCPFRIGGGPTETAKVFGFLKRAVGVGGSSTNDLSVEALWRRSKSKGIVVGRSADARVVYNALPQFATDFLPYFERLLQLTPDTDATESERRDDVVTGWVGGISAVLPALLVAVQEIDPVFSFPEVPADAEVTSLPGRVFAPFDVGGESPAFGGTSGGCSRLAMYSTYDVLRVELATPYDGPLTPADLRKIERAKALLLRVLPSWNDFWIYVRQPGMASQAQFLAGATPAGFGAPA